MHDSADAAYRTATGRAIWSRHSARRHRLDYKRNTEGAKEKNLWECSSPERKMTFRKDLQRVSTRQVGSFPSAKLSISHARADVRQGMQKRQESPVLCPAWRRHDSSRQ